MQHQVRVIDLQENCPVPRDLLRESALAVLARYERRPVRINLVLMDDRQIRDPNRRFLGHDHETDVLAFRYAGTLAGTDGEVLLSVETALRESMQRAIPAQEEILRYVIHGVLHFVGFRDETPRAKKAMMRAQEGILRTIRLRGRAKE